MNSSESTNEPILLISFERTLEITNEGILYFTNLNDSKISILTIIGGEHTGKTAFLNQLLGTNYTLPKTKSPTQKGIWAWGQPIPLDTLEDNELNLEEEIEENHNDNSGNNNTILLLVLYCDGLTFKKEKNFIEIKELLTNNNISNLNREDSECVEKKLFMICSLISSSLIYNVNVTELSFDENYSRLTQLSECLLEILIKNNKKITSNYLPELIWLARDPNSTKSQETLTNEFASKTSTLELFTNYFTNNIFFYLDSLDQMEEVTQYMLTNIKPKCIKNTMQNQYITGKAIYGILQNYTECLNIFEYPIIKDSIECVRLSNTNETTDIIIERSKAQIKTSIQTDNLILVNKNTHSLLIEGLKEFFSLPVTEIIPTKKLSPYIERIVSFHIDELNKYSNQTQIKYEEMLKSLEFITQKDKLTSLNNINTYFKSFSDEIGKLLYIVLGNPRFKFHDDAYAIVNKNICERLLSLGTSIEFLTRNLLKEKNNLKEQKELNETKTSQTLNEKTKMIFKLSAEKEKLERDLKSKEKEYENSLEIRERNFNSAKNDLRTIISEKDKKIKILEDEKENLYKEIIEIRKLNLQQKEKIHELENSLENFKGKKNTHSSSKLEFSMLNIKSIYDRIHSMFLEYKSSLDSLEHEKGTIFGHKSIETNIKESDLRITKLFEEFNTFKDKEIQLIRDGYEKTIRTAHNKINELNFEIDKLKYEQSNNKEKISELELKHEETKKQAQAYAKSSNCKDSLITTQKEAIDLYQQKVGEYSTKISDLESNLNSWIIHYKMKVEENETLFLIFCSILRKDKETYEIHYKKLSTEMQKKVQTFVNLYKTFK